MATALRAKAFSLNGTPSYQHYLYIVIFYDPYIEHGRAKALGVTQVSSLKELLQQSDVISVHCPLVHNNIR